MEKGHETFTDWIVDQMADKDLVQKAFLVYVNDDDSLSYRSYNAVDYEVVGFLTTAIHHILHDEN